MEQREKLIELLDKLDVYDDWLNNEAIADLLIANGVVVLPCRCGECEQRIGGNFCKHLNTSVINNFFYCAGAKRKGGDE